MPRVMCIDDDWKSFPPNIPKPQIYQDYIAIDERKCSCGCGAIMLVLAEFGPMYGYSKKNFIELDGQDEQEMVQYMPSQNTRDLTVAGFEECLR